MTLPEVVEGFMRPEVQLLFCFRLNFCCSNPLVLAAAERNGYVVGLLFTVGDERTALK